MRQFFELPNGSERIINLYMPGDFFTNNKTSLVSGGLVPTNFQAVGRVDCYAINMTHLCDLCLEIPEFSNFIMMLMIRMNSECLTRIRMLLIQSQGEKYEYLIRNEDEMLNIFPLKYIAQYLGMAPESLSRLRKQIMLSRGL